jgi:hypothetical protein
MMFCYLLNTLVASIDQCISKGKPSLGISIIYLKKSINKRTVKYQTTLTIRTIIQ